MSFIIINYCYDDNIGLTKFMSKRRIEDKNIRKLTRIGSSSLGVTIPVEFLRELKWREKQKLVLNKRDNKITIEDWKK